MEDEIKEKARQIVKTIENLNVRDWEKLKQIIDSRYLNIKLESNFSCDKVTQNRIDDWF